MEDRKLALQKEANRIETEIESLKEQLINEKDDLVASSIAESVLALQEDLGKLDKIIKEQE